MHKNYILFTTLLLMFIFCENPDKTKSDLRTTLKRLLLKLTKKTIVLLPKKIDEKLSMKA